MDTLADVVAETRDRDGVAFDAPSRTTPYSSHEFATNAWKAGNLLSHYGARAGATVAVVVGPAEPDADDEPGRLGATPAPLLATLGATLVGAVVELEPDSAVDATALVAPATWLDRYDPSPGTSVLAYGSAADDPSVAHFERELWSENPVEPPETVAADVLALASADSHLTHAAVIGRARTVVAEAGIEPDDRVVIDAPLSNEVFVAGVVAPLLVGATIVAGPADEAAVTVGAGGDIG